MALASNNYSSWLGVTTNSLSLKCHPFVFFYNCKPSFIPVCSKSNGHAESDSPSLSVSTRSNSRRSYSPRKFDNPLEIERHWIEADQQFVSPENFTVASYNILGDRNASQHRDLYLNVPSHYLKWDHRKRVICKELFGWNADIICLQEVDRYFDLSNILVKAGYTGSYKRRTGDSIDGCAMFWKSNKFRLLEGENIEFKAIGLRDNVAQVLVFEMCEADSRRLVIGNIHVLYNPSRGEVKLGQIRHLLSRAQTFSEKWGDAPIVLAGDFNSTPKSGVYKFLSSSELDIKLYDRRELSGQKSCHPAQVLGYKKDTVNPANLSILMDRLLMCWTDDEVKMATGNSESHLVVHPLKLNSSYATVKGSTSTRELNGEPLATSFHSKFLGTVDYLWYSDGIVATRVLDTLPIDVLRKTGGLPCKSLGSDHLALVSEFAFSTRNNSTTEIVSAAASLGLDIKEHDNLQA